jgi:hypothetical protein
LSLSTFLERFCAQLLSATVGLGLFFLQEIHHIMVLQEIYNFILMMEIKGGIVVPFINRNIQKIL